MQRASEFRAKGIRVSCKGHLSFVQRGSLHLDTLCVCANCSIGASGVMAVPLLRDEGASLEEWRNSAFLHRRFSFTKGPLLRDEGASGEEVEKLNVSSSTTKGGVACMEAFNQCMDHSRIFVAHIIAWHFRSLGKGMHEFQRR